VKVNEDDTCRLNRLLVEAGQEPVDCALSARFDRYLALILRWNQRINLTSIRDEEGILKRHFVESITCARALPAEIQTLLDFGSGAGLPGIPIALCRPEIAVTLSESQGKKAAFLREAMRILGVNARVHAARAEALTERFDCVALRAVDEMGIAVRASAGLVGPGGWLAILASVADSSRMRSAAGTGIRWREPLCLPYGESRVLILGQAMNTPFG
jgi:16S rRNA (guanine527-N7)-methyltransferase